MRAWMNRVLIAIEWDAFIDVTPGPYFLPNIHIQTEVNTGATVFTPHVSLVRLGQMGY